LRFNDPFDHQIDFKFDFTQTNFIESYLASLEQAIFGDEEMIFDTRDTIGVLNSKMREARSELDKSEVLKTMREGIEETAKRLDKFENDINAELQKHLRIARVLCLSESNDNVVMWSHYADNHKGIVMRLRCIDEIDNTLLAAKKIVYQRELPAIASIEEIVKSFIGIQKYNYANLYADLPYIKHTDWEYEQEWRAAFPEEVTNTKLYNDYRENPIVFGAIYLGCRIEPTDEAEIMSLLTGHLSHVEVYSAVKKETRVWIEFCES